MSTLVIYPTNPGRDQNWTLGRSTFATTLMGPVRASMSSEVVA